jgi:hypothetical protein
LINFLLLFFLFCFLFYFLFCCFLNSNLISNLFCRNSRLGLHINTIHTLLVQYVVLGRSLGVLHTITFWMWLWFWLGVLIEMIFKDSIFVFLLKSV